MQPKEIASFVSDRAAAFGFDNPQQLQFCASRLRSVSEEQVLAGLLLVFTHGTPPPTGTAAQELAGRLLFALMPKGKMVLKDFLRLAISKYELSVEQLPQYLMHLCGKEAVAATLRLLEAENLESNERRALSTMQFWVRNLPEHL
jgi:hypothetical protein